MSLSVPDRLIVSPAPVVREIQTEDNVALRAYHWPGDGLPLILVHGLASTALLWQGVAAILSSAGRELVAVDIRGHGASGQPEAGYDQKTVVSDLVLVADVFGFRESILVGQSWGGNLVVQAAAAHPDRFRGIVAVDGGTIDLADRYASWNECQKALTPPKMTGRSAQDIEDLLRSTHPDWPETGIQGALGCYRTVPDGTLTPRLLLEHHLAILHDLYDHGPAEALSRLSVPAIFLAAGSPEAPGPWSASRKRSIDSAVESVLLGRVEWLEGDHDLHAQHPDRVAQLIDQFSRDVTSQDNDGD